MSKWNYISIKDGEFVGKLPEDGEDIILTTEGGFVVTDIFCREDNGGCFFENYDLDEVRAWMPMPFRALPDEKDRSRILRAVGRYIQTQAEENGLKALGVNGTVYNVEDVLQELDAVIREEEGEA